MMQMKCDSENNCTTIRELESYCFFNLFFFHSDEDIKKVGLLIQPFWTIFSDAWGVGVLKLSPSLRLIALCPLPWPHPFCEGVYGVFLGWKC